MDPLPDACRVAGDDTPYAKTQLQAIALGIADDDEAGMQKTRDMRLIAASHGGQMDEARARATFEFFAR